MSDSNNALPPSERVPIHTLVRIFRNTRNSYKYLLFLALLRKLKNPFYKGNRTFSLEDLQAEMLTIAWYPHTYFKLSFGSQDQVAKKLRSLPDPEIKLKVDNEKHLSKLK